ncbi:MAG: ABC transporter ATP-binding protein [Ruminococcus sp.]|nr:ABC transporter ATP-binding protein [Ruminococcus sp.]MBR2304199.1 ABC transporter ATP-binding protein [Ruminococcus sp.]
MDVLKVEGLVKTFRISEKQRRALELEKRVKTAVDGISFTARPGEVFGLLGPNGAGKTTTMRMLATLIKPDKGDAHYGDVSVVNEPEKVRSQLAFLTTDLQLDKRSTANIMFDFFAELHRLDKETAAKRKTELFDSFNIGGYADQKIAKLSQGQRQKVSIAISVLHDPQYIIFDEPTNGLDIIAARDVRDYILRTKAEGKCVIISTHLFDLVEKICDRAAMIIDGKIAADDTLEALMHGGSLEDAFYEVYTQYHKV